MRISNNSASRPPSEAKQLLHRVGIFQNILSSLIYQQRLIITINKGLLNHTYDLNKHLKSLVIRRLQSIILCALRQRVKRQKLTCLLCECRIYLPKIPTHLKVCSARHKLRKELDTIDSDIHMANEDVKALEAKLIKIRSQKLRLVQDSVKKQPQRIQVYKKNLAKSSPEELQVRRGIMYKGSDSDSGSSASLDSKKPHTAHSSQGDLQKESIESIQELIDQLQEIKTLVQQILSQREVSTINLPTNLRVLNERLIPKVKRLNSALPELQKIMHLFQARAKTMTRLRKLADTDEPQIRQQAHTLEELQTSYQRKSRKWTRYFTEDKATFSEEESTPRSYTNPSKTRLSDFETIKVLGRGNFAKVFLVRKIKTGALYALKRVKLVDTENFTHYLRNETEVFEKIHSPYLVNAEVSFSEGQNHYFLMEYMPNGNLHELLRREKRLYDDEAALYLAEIALGIAHLHQHGIIHKDIKPSNIVIDATGHIKLTDYGLSQVGLIKQKTVQVKHKHLSRFVTKNIRLRKRLGPKQEENKEVQSAGVVAVGSPFFMAPQVLQGLSATQMSDWWSYGILVYFCLIGRVPFVANIQDNLTEFSKIVHQRQIWPPQIKFGSGELELSFQAKDLIQRLLVIDPKQRIGKDIEDIKAHSFFRNLNWDKLPFQQVPFEFPHQDLVVEKEECDLESQCDTPKVVRSERQSTFGGNPSTKGLVRRDLQEEWTMRNYLQTLRPLVKLMKTASRITV